MTASTAENSSTRRRVREALIEFSLLLALGWLIAMAQGSASREADRGAARYGLRMTRRPSNGGRKRGPRVRASLSDGARRARTADLLIANQALSQLSYSPGMRPV